MTQRVSDSNSDGVLTVPEGLSLIQLHQMIFIYNAVMAGWAVKRVEEDGDGQGSFRFRKRVKTKAQRRMYEAGGFLQRFVQNMQRLDSMPVRSTGNITALEQFELPVDEDIPM